MCNRNFLWITNRLCRLCVVKRNKTDSKSFEEWPRTVYVGKFQMNFPGLSGAVEAERALMMWRRSEDKKGYRHVTFLGDGDLSSYKAVCNINERKGLYKDNRDERRMCKPCSEKNGNETKEIER